MKNLNSKTLAILILSVITYSCGTISEARFYDKYSKKINRARKSNKNIIVDGAIGRGYTYSMAEQSSRLNTLRNISQQINLDLSSSEILKEEQNYLFGSNKTSSGSQSLSSLTSSNGEYNFGQNETIFLKHGKTKDGEHLVALLIKVKRDQVKTISK